MHLLTEEDKSEPVERKRVRVQIDGEIIPLEASAEQWDKDERVAELTKGESLKSSTCPQGISSLSFTNSMWLLLDVALIENTTRVGTYDLHAGRFDC